MSDEPTTVTPAGDEPKAEPTPQPGGDEPPKGDEPKAKTYTQTELDKITSSGEKTRIKLENENKALREAAMSDEDKKLQAARDEGSAEWKGKLEAKLREDDVRDALMESDINPKRVKHATTLANKLYPDATPEEAADKLRAEMPELFGTKNRGQFGPSDGAPPRTAAGYGFDAAGVEEARLNLTSTDFISWYRTNRENIMKAQGLKPDPQSAVLPGNQSRVQT